ncbi:hypothetical protein SAMN05444365_103232 [Micromonospora pattaloongensis]|uniref:Excreted virulence factor EspC, type VII ESX diderm n=1 Tax=Micromonospora pattaloongensis TaxID=405436 RepID=A0A1H3M641_9ACTN|nr:hypothetical protein [Micromonospora pattaloongensis]SDY71679.1 hypothetical protein SAMN05444365_103232 [Micromonospora pattaloongensis]
MSDDLLWLDPAQAHRGGVDLAYAGRAITAARDGLGARIAAASADPPWGRDDIGAAFEKTYRQFETLILGSWRSVGGYVEGLGANVVQSVRANVETDAAAAQRVRDTAI